MKLSAGRVARSHEEASSSSEQIATERLLLAHAAQVHSRLQDLRISQQKACILNSATRQRAVSAINSLISTLQNARNEIDTEVDQTETRNDAICAQLEMNLQAEIQGLSLVEARLRDRKRTPDTVQAAIHNAHSLDSPPEATMSQLDTKEECSQDLLRSVNRLCSEWNIGRCSVPKSGFKRKHVPIAPSRDCS